jgi:hypothetical protein
VVIADPSDDVRVEQAGRRVAHRSASRAARRAAAPF